MRKAVSIVLYMVLVTAQLGVPAWMIAERELTLRYGRQFKFRTVPVDPYDAFRGRYVRLGLEENSAPRPRDVRLKDGQHVYVELGEDQEGFATLERVSVQRPPGEAYVRARLRHVGQDTVNLDLPIDRYYLEERAAPQAEQAYRDHSRRGGVRDAYVTVRVRSGRAVLEQLYVGGVPILEYIKAEPAGSS